MTKRDFFLIIVRLFALYWFISLLMSTARFVVPIAQGGDSIAVVFGAAAFAIMLLLFALLAFQSHRVVNFLGLDKGFEDPVIEFGNMKGKEILKLGVIIVGGLALLKGIPLVLIDGYLWLRAEVGEEPMPYSRGRTFAFGIAEFVMGLILITNNDRIAGILDQEQKA